MGLMLTRNSFSLLVHMDIHVLLNTLKKIKIMWFSFRFTVMHCFVLFCHINPDFVVTGQMWKNSINTFALMHNHLRTHDWHWKIKIIQSCHEVTRQRVVAETECFIFSKRTIVRILILYKVLIMFLEMYYTK